MHLQAPTLSIPHRAQVLSALAAVAVAGGAWGAITVATNDDSSATSSQTPAVTKADSGRVLDGSPLVRGATATAFVTVPHPRLDGGPFLPKSGLPKSGAPLQSALQPPKGQPEGFHGQ
jgi:hypothetical protein